MVFVAQPADAAGTLAPSYAADILPTVAAEVMSEAILSGWRRLGFITAALFVAIGITFQLGSGAIMAGRIMPGISVAGIEIGGKTRPEARAMLREAVQTSRTTLQIKGISHKVTATQIGMVYDIEQTLERAYEAGRGHVLVPVQIWSAYQHQGLSYAYELDEKAGGSFVQNLAAANGRPARDAAIVIKDGNPVVEPDVNGLALTASTIREAAAKQLSTLSDDTVVLKPTVQVARIRSADVLPAVEATKQLLGTPITITYENKTFKPTLAQMGEWVIFEKAAEGSPPGLTPVISTDGIKHYLQSVAVAIHVNPVNRKLHIQNGDTQEVQAGQDGLQLDQASLTELVAKSVKAKQPLAVAAPTVKIPFKTEYNRTVSLDYGKYIEVNLSLQRLWVYQDHKVIYDSPLTSGAAGSGFPTVTGLFQIQSKQQNRNLNGYAIGYDYYVFVKYWMPFYGNYGLHDASWRGGFGGQDYYYGGSHGCVNLPEATAAFIYGWADVGTPVWVHQ